MPLKSILKPSTILTDHSAIDFPSPSSQTTNTPTSNINTYSPPSFRPPPSPQNLPSTSNQIKRKALPTLDCVFPSQTPFIDSESSARHKPQASSTSSNQKQRLDRNLSKKVGFVTPVASYIPDPPPLTPESEEESDEGYDHKLSEIDSNRFDDGHDQDVKAEHSTPLTSRSAANPTISLDDILRPSQVAGTDTQSPKEGKWTSRASERIKAGNKMLVGAGNGIRYLRKGFGGRGREGV